MRKIVPDRFELSGKLYRHPLIVRLAAMPNLPSGCNYLEGLGGCYFGPRFNDELYPVEYGNILLYYKKGAFTVGTPISRSVLTSTPESKEAQFSVSISPNPINSIASIEVKNRPSNALIVFCLSDLLGNEVMHQELTTDKMEIARGSLPPGLYVYAIKNQTQILKMGKVVLE